jgi:hypothetical protein
MLFGKGDFGLAMEGKRQLPLEGMCLGQGADATNLARLCRPSREQRADHNSFIYAVLLYLDEMLNKVIW